MRSEPLRLLERLHLLHNSSLTLTLATFPFRVKDKAIRRLTSGSNPVRGVGMFTYRRHLALCSKQSCFRCPVHRCQYPSTRMSFDAIEVLDQGSKVRRLLEMAQLTSFSSVLRAFARRSEETFFWTAELSVLSLICSRRPGFFNEGAILSYVWEMSLQMDKQTKEIF